MKLRDTLGTLILPGTVPTGNLVWVDSVSGNDSLATRGRLTVPFQTLTAAKTAAQSGDTIMVMPGTYNEKDLAKNGVNWHFLNGAIVNYSGAGTGGIFDVASAMTFKVTGDGELTVTSGGGTNYVLNVTNSSANITLKCLKMTSPNTCVRASTGTVSVGCDSVYSSSDAAVDVSGGTVTLRIRNISSYGSHGVSISGGTVEIESFKINGYTGRGIYFTGGTATALAYEVSSDSNYGVEYAGSGVLTVVGARVWTKLNQSTGNNKAAYITSGSSSGAPATLRFMRCIFVTTYTTSNFTIGGVSGRVVGLYGDCVANIAHDSTNVTTQITTLIVSSNVQP